MKIELRNNFHGTSITLRVAVPTATLSHSQMRRVKTLCPHGGMPQCGCGYVRGPQDIEVEPTQDTYNERIFDTYEIREKPITNEWLND